MNTLGSLEGYKRCTTSTGTITFSITDLNFADENDYEVLVLCGQAYPICNNRAASPPVTTRKTATSFDVQVTTAPACVLIVVNNLKGKVLVP